MSTYKVKTIALAVKKNRIAKFGETVDESELTVSASELVESGALEIVTDEIEVVAEKVSEEIEETVVEKVVEKVEVKKAPTASQKATKK